ncbi:MAG: hypothetical protein WAO76_08250 [Georgfuchsia sp.]|jgi:hypothetical protein
MRIAAVHQITGKKSCVTNLRGSLSKIATHPSCQKQAYGYRYCYGLQANEKMTF